MEASVGQDPASTETTTAQPAEGGEKGGELEESVGRLTDRLGQFMDRVAPQDSDQDVGLWDLTADELYGDFDDDDDEDDEGMDQPAVQRGDQDAEAEAERHAQEVLNQFIDQRVQEKLGPYMEGQAEERRMGQLQALEDKYPDLKSQEHARPLLEKAQEIAATLGAPDLAYEAPFLETVYLRERTAATVADEDRAAGEGGSDTALETAGSAAGSGGEETDLADEIAQARPGGAARHFLTGH